MTNEKVKEAIDNLMFTMDMIMFDPMTGQMKSYEDLNPDDRCTYDGCFAGIEALKKQMPLKADLVFRVRPEIDSNGAYINGDIIADYHCPICNNWLSCDSAYEPDELQMYCSKCGHYIEGVADD